MIEELIERTFAVRNAAQLAHWRAKGPGSYARHSALGDFYDAVIDKLDGIVEAYQGMTGSLVGFIKAGTMDTRRDIVDMLQSECDWIKKNRESIAEEHCAIENMLDELCGLYLTTIYKLKFLA